MELRADKFPRSREITAEQRRIGWHWLWFLPLCTAVLLVVERHTALHGIRLVKLAYQRWVWAAVLSPSAYICLAVILTSVLVPIQALIYILGSLANGQQRRYIFAIVLAIFLLPFASDAVTWVRSRSMSMIRASTGFA